jgi:hypothetical protein
VIRFREADRRRRAIAILAIFDPHLSRKIADAGPAIGGWEE